MGKRKRRLLSPKYALKAAALREKVARLRGQIEEKVETIQETIEEVAEEVIEKVEETVKPRVNALKQQPEEKSASIKKAETKSKKTAPATRKKRTTKTKTDS